MPDAREMNAEHDDAFLVKSVLRGEMKAFEKLVRLNEKLVLSIVFKIIQQAQDREDICQEVFIKVYDKLSSFRFQSKLSTWIGNIAFNTCINFLKKRKPLSLKDLYKTEDMGEENYYSEGPALLMDETTPHKQLEKKEQEIFLLTIMENLSIIQKTVLELFHKNDLSLQEISDITSLPVSTVKSHLFRARKLLRDEMNKYLNL